MGGMHMAGPLKIIAMPNPSVAELHGDDLDSDLRRIRAAAPGLGYEFISTYDSLNDLITKIAATLARKQDCLRILEINAHGNPQLCNGVTLAKAAAFGAQLKSLNLCDVVDVYLTGCNTGVHDNGGPSVAQAVSAAAPTAAANNVQCTIYGSVGYLSGTNAEGNASCSEDARTSTGKKKRYFAPYPPSQDGKQRGSMKAGGAACYRGFREGKPI